MSRRTIRPQSDLEARPRHLSDSLSSLIASVGLSLAIFSYPCSAIQRHIFPLSLSFIGPITDLCYIDPTSIRFRGQASSPVRSFVTSHIRLSLAIFLPYFQFLQSLFGDSMPPLPYPSLLSVLSFTFDISKYKAISSMQCLNFETYCLILKITLKKPSKFIHCLTSILNLCYIFLCLRPPTLHKYLST